MQIFFFLALALIVLFFLTLKYSPLPPESDETNKPYCQDVIKDPNAPRITAPAYTGSGVDTSQTRTYKMVKKKVPVPAYFFANTHHFFQPFSETRTDPQTSQKYLLKLPNGENGRSYKIPTEGGGENYFVFADVGLIYMFYLNQDGSPMIIDRFIRPADGGPQEVALADLYILEDKELPEWISRCMDAGTNGQTDNIVFEKKEIYTPSQNPSLNQEQLQLQYFLLQKYKLMLQAWWTPHCKPAIYLYPPKNQLVNVKVIPDGFLTYTDPIYNDKNGWTVMAYPNGTIQNISTDSDNSKFYQYLYFESKIRDALITKPTNGWTIKYEDLTTFYQDILPKLQFSEKQKTDFIEYWQKSLPKAPYYFVSLVDQTEVNKYEELLITPNPVAIRRIRFYFEARESFEQVPPLDLAPWQKNSQIENNDFTVFEWGGMVKRDKNHPYTCSM